MSRLTLCSQATRPLEEPVTLVAVSFITVSWIHISPQLPLHPYAMLPFLSTFCLLRYSPVPALTGDLYPRYPMLVTACITFPRLRGAPLMGVHKHTCLKSPNVGAQT
jgi:hypothetical protein